MTRTKFAGAILIVLMLLVWTVQPIMACSSTSGDSTEEHSGSGIAAKLAFIQQPTNTVSGAHISPAVAVVVQDAHGNTVTSSTLSITVVISHNPSGGKLAGVTRVSAIKGVATFANLSIDKPGTGYTLKATTSCEITGTSNAFNITVVTPPIVTTPVVTNPITIVTPPIVTAPVVTNPITIVTPPVVTAPVVTTPVTETAPALLQVSITGLIVNSPPVFIDQGGYIQGNYELTSKDGTVTLEVPNGNGCWDSQGRALTSINGGIATATPANTGDDAMVLAYTFGPDGANFNPSLTLTLKYDPAITTIKVLENSLYAEGYDGTQWQRLDGVVNKAAKTITIQISHFSTYVVMGKLMPPPAVAAPPTTNAINQTVSLSTSIPVTTPSDSSLVATIDATATDPTTTQAPNIPLVVSPQPNQVPSWLILVVIAAGLLVLLVVMIIRRRRSYD